LRSNKTPINEIWVMFGSNCDRDMIDALQNDLGAGGDYAVAQKTAISSFDKR
jgi:phosphoribosylformylglycinamidine (FGAM) synthase-like amidotransferase family enzyme